MTLWQVHDHYDALIEIIENSQKIIRMFLHVCFIAFKGFDYHGCDSLNIAAYKLAWLSLTSVWSILVFLYAIAFETVRCLNEDSAIGIIFSTSKLLLSSNLFFC